MTLSERAAKAPTLKDVAAQAGVSLATAGRVLRNETYPVDKVLAERVRQVAITLGYVPNVIARSLRGGAPSMVGLIIGDMVEPYYAEIAEAITQHAEATHKALAIVCNMQRDPLLELKYCQQLWEHRVSGLVLAGGGFDQQEHKEALRALLSRMVQSGVIVTALSPRDLGIPEFAVDNVVVGRMMAEELTKHGHRKIGIISGPPQSPVTQLRVSGAIEAIEKVGGEYEVTNSTLNPGAGAAAVERLVSIRPDLTGFIVGSGSIALGVMRKLRELGRQIPRDASVVTVGNTRLAEWSDPPLVTIDIRLADCGRQALDYIHNKLKGLEAKDAVSMSVRVTNGASVGKPAKR
ncbi:LacI family DNA-binding transcriptional regulator [Sphingorhabdus lacus]|uniref:LacI family transcriptional regulator n=1 Tax=Sphingorhabdus lacus TaxID=392610 RepID=A0A6I6LAK7_9SPHN|nr:LacI family DNA-binding transcriptional regulator [Sphingorhabdus lacus]QGY79273.1 LacI family transcriptional regulator [Sphingorhabdus lacus]